MVVSAYMHHQRTTCNICCLEARGEYRLTGVTIRIDEECGQISKMAITPRGVMTFRIARIIVPPRCKCRNHLAIPLLGVTAWILVQM